MPTAATPYYLIDERKLLRNLKIIRRVRERSGAKSVLALKCFATWSVFGLMREYLDGTTSSGVYEARLGREKFGKEVHAYSVGYSRDDVRAVRNCADKVIFNSLSQLRAFAREVRGLKVGVRVNPNFSRSHYDLADPARAHSRLGVRDGAALRAAAGLFSGIMFHFNCENDSFAEFAADLERLGGSMATCWSGWTGSAWAAAWPSPSAAIRWGRSAPPCGSSASASVSKSTWSPARRRSRAARSW